MKNGATLNFIVGCGPLVVHLLATENQTLLWRWNAFFFFNTFLNSFHFIRGFNVDFNLFTSQRLDLNQHYVEIITYLKEIKISETDLENYK